MSHHVPSGSGIYCVYECTYREEDDTVAVEKLIYIGEAKDVREAVINDEKLDEWRRHIEKEKELCFSCGLAKEDDIRERIFAALVFRMKPPLNEKYNDSFPFPATRLLSRGSVDHLIIDFTLETTP